MEHIIIVESVLNIKKGNKSLIIILREDHCYHFDFFSSQFFPSVCVYA